MNFKQLQSFISTAKNGSIAAAARELEIAQPAISQQVANMEHELKTKLFERDFRGVRLTDSGIVFHSHAQIMLQQLNQAKLEIINIEKNPSGVVTLGMTPAIGNIISIPLITELQNRYPNIDLQLTTATSSNLMQCLLNHNIDIALTYASNGNFGNVISRPLIEEELYLVIGKNTLSTEYKKLFSYHQITFEELSSFEITSPNKTDSLTSLLHQCELETGIKLRFIPGFGQLMSTLRYVMEGRGAMIAPSSAIHHLESTGSVKAIKITNPELLRHVVANTHVERPTTRAMKIVLDEVESIVKKMHNKGVWRGKLPFDKCMKSS